MEHRTATLTSVVLTLVSFLAPIGTNLSYHSYGMPLDRNRDIHITGATGGDDSLLECDIARRESGVGTGRQRQKRGLDRWRRRRRRRALSLSPCGLVGSLSRAMLAAE